LRPEAGRAKGLATLGSDNHPRFPDIYNIIHYRAQNYEGTSKDYEFSRRTMEEHWTAGYNDTVRNLRHPET
jgi:hypothetical protein